MFFIRQVVPPSLLGDKLSDSCRSQHSQWSFPRHMSVTSPHWASHICGADGFFLSNNSALSYDARDVSKQLFVLVSGRKGMVRPHDAPNCGSNDGASAKAALGSGWGTKEISDQQKEGCKICKSMQEVFANPATGQDSPAARLGHAVPWRCAKMGGWMYLCAKTKMPKRSDSEISVIAQESCKVMIKLEKPWTM